VIRAARAKGGRFKGRVAVSFGDPILKTASECRPRANVITAMAAKLGAFKRRPLDPTGILFTQPDRRPWRSLMKYAWRRARPVPPCGTNAEHGRLRACGEPRSCPR
jgi:hypothetical protein